MVRGTITIKVKGMDEDLLRDYLESLADIIAEDLLSYEVKIGVKVEE